MQLKAHDMNALNILFLMDPLSTVKMDKDTSFILMIGAARKGHRVFFLPQGGMRRLDGKTFFEATRVTPRLEKSAPFEIHETTSLTEDAVDIIFIRTDPPFNEQYLFDTWLLDLLPKHIAVINDPGGIRTVNEKLWATRFTDLIPPTLVSRHKQHILKFLKDHGDIILKPSNGFGGRSVFRITANDINRNALIEQLTGNQSLEIIAQRFVPESAAGDKRIILLNGHALGAVLRVHGQDDHRNNFFAGGSPQAATITPGDQRVIETLRPHLQKLGLYFVGIDVIGDHLIEVNVTSPTGLQEINRLNRNSLEDDVIAFAEDLLKTKRQS